VRRVGVLVPCLVRLHEEERRAGAGQLGTHARPTVSRAPAGATRQGDVGIG
jgi:hypothetical protein